MKEKINLNLIALLKSKLDASYIYELHPDSVLTQDRTGRIYEKRLVRGVIVENYITTLDVIADDYLEALATRADLIN